jgi:hypothetical protein
LPVFLSLPSVFRTDGECNLTNGAVLADAQPVREAREVEAAVVAGHGDGARGDGREAHDAGVEGAAFTVGVGVFARWLGGWRGVHGGMVEVFRSGCLREDGGAAQRSEGGCLWVFFDQFSVGQALW